jgi:hypothetical protein
LPWASRNSSGRVSPYAFMVVRIHVRHRTRET